ncbi:hypothetical protein BJ994_003039 [Arthrobacter pigmenti]|uniref:Uncharacterized protein n=1 Tax=Arthrobacter pigmenti TaxID=271432 RepID=A0A846RL77_9MICC|nr:hypothetical protein [Arthrobacter pigmenti]NJC23963.1 hypothetical protein [Arthrobacter pigmenti]
MRIYPILGGALLLTAGIVSLVEATTYYDDNGNEIQPQDSVDPETPDGQAQ